jgi:hypothetical protein
LWDTSRISQSELIISRFIQILNSPSPKSARLPRRFLAGLDLGEGREGGQETSMIFISSSLNPYNS